MGESPPYFFKRKYMKIQIVNDLFEIANRLLEIDESYYVVFDTVKNRFEVWTNAPKNTMCFVVKNKTLDCRVLQYALSTSSKNAYKIYERIEKENKNNSDRIITKIKDENESKFKEIFNYEKLSKEMDPNKSYKTVWV